jgi:hypothetical protein
MHRIIVLWQDDGHVLLLLLALLSCPSWEMFNSLFLVASSSPIFLCFPPRWVGCNSVVVPVVVVVD